MKCCPQCGNPLPEIRCGVRLPPLKARIFDLIKRAGVGGIDSADLHDLVYADGGLKYNWRKRTPRRPSIKAHIWQINELIEDTNYKIVAFQDDENIWLYRLSARNRNTGAERVVHHQGAQPSASPVLKA